jgi:hypothetical protein
VVRTAGDQPVTIWADGHGGDPVLMAAQDVSGAGRVGR